MKVLHLIVMGCLVALVSSTLVGCLDDCSDSINPGDDCNCGIKHNNRQRSYLLYVPDNYDSQTPTALVIDCHGLFANAKNQAGIEPWTYQGQTYEGMGSGYRMVADREGFIVANPQGLGNIWDQNDVDFLMAVVDEIVTAAGGNVDTDRIYITGISNGGQITYWSSCRQQTGVYRGLSPVASNLRFETCESVAEPAPLIAFHSVDDGTIDYQEGLDAVEAWALANNCQNGPYPSMTFGGSGAGQEEVCYEESATGFELAACDPNNAPTSCETWDQCDNGVEVVFCTVPTDVGANGHILYRNSTKLSLAAVTWQFWSTFQP